MHGLTLDIVVLANQSTYPDVEGYPKRNNYISLRTFQKIHESSSI